MNQNGKQKYNFKAIAKRSVFLCFLVSVFMGNAQTEIKYSSPKLPGPVQRIALCQMGKKRPNPPFIKETRTMPQNIFWKRLWGRPRIFRALV